MKLKDQVCSLESAKKLKDLGVKQDSLWYWVNHFGHLSVNLNKEKCIASTFTVAELGEMLPVIIYPEKGRLSFHLEQWKTNAEARYNVWYRRNADNNDMFVQIEKTEAESKARMLIYLLENRLIEKVQ